MTKTALITGITGQDGSYLAELLIDKGYEVHGIIRRSSNFNTQRLEHIYEEPFAKNRKLILHYGDLLDTGSITKVIQKTKPNEIYNLGAQSHVGVSFEEPIYSSDVNALGTLRVLESIKLLGLHKKINFTKLLPLRYLVIQKIFLKMRNQVLSAFTVRLQSYTHIG